jgi:hypothetical protein
MTSKEERNALGPKQRRRRTRKAAAPTGDLFRDIYISFEKMVSYPFHILL